MLALRCTPVCTMRAPSMLRSAWRGTRSCCLSLHRGQTLSCSVSGQFGSISTNSALISVSILRFSSNYLVFATQQRAAVHLRRPSYTCAVTGRGPHWLQWLPAAVQWFKPLHNSAVLKCFFSGSGTILPPDRGNKVSKLVKIPIKLFLWECLWEWWLQWSKTDEYWWEPLLSSTQVCYWNPAHRRSFWVHCHNHRWNPQRRQERPQ